jgi:hypothetical protein
MLRMIFWHLILFRLHRVPAHPPLRHADPLHPAHPPLRHADPLHPVHLQVAGALRVPRVLHVFQAHPVLHASQAHQVHRAGAAHLALRVIA